MLQIPAPKFDLGKLVATPTALQVIEESGQSPWAFFFRHMSGNWGDISEYDKRLNEHALEEGNRLMSVYRTNRGTKLHVITEADRRLTTLLLAEEY